MFFDVETNGLYGEAFAVGYVVTTGDGTVIGEGIHHCWYNEAEPDKNDPSPRLTEEFLTKFVLPAMINADCHTPGEVRGRFFEAWQKAKADADSIGEPLYLVADVAYPCETRFLLQVRNDGEPGEFSVYPLLDNSTMLIAKGFDPVATLSRRDDELPAHNPLADARQTMRVWFQLARGEKPD